MEPPVRCDPALLSCITSEEIQTVLPFIFIAVGVVSIWMFVRFERKEQNGPSRRRGTAPGDGETVNVVNMNTRNGHVSQIVTRHTKDPQKHAQAMMPAKARKKDH